MFFNVAMRASRQLHDAMFAGVTKATMFFFNTNPSGRILNRFSKDVGQIDETLPFILVDVFQALFGMIGAIGVLAVVNPFYLIPTFLLFSIFFFLRKFYLKTSLDIKRLQSTSKLNNQLDFSRLMSVSISTFQRVLQSTRTFRKRSTDCQRFGHSTQRKFYRKSSITIKTCTHLLFIFF
jgi:ABC-type multidrug transport system fused ATPase/permease subunit